MKRVIFALLLMAGVASASTNEITVSTLLKAKKDATDITRQTGTLLIQMAGNRYNVQTIAATTTNTVLSKGSVVSPGLCYMRNLSTNPTAQINITFDAGTTTSLVLKAEEPALFRASSAAIITNWTASANAGSVDFEFTVLEN